MSLKISQNYLFQGAASPGKFVLIFAATVNSGRSFTSYFPVWWYNSKDQSSLQCLSAQVPQKNEQAEAAEVNLMKQLFDIC